MLYLCIDYGTKGEQRRVGDDLSFFIDTRLKYIEADGEELVQALRITGLPLTGISMKFPKPWADLIILNWLNP